MAKRKNIFQLPFETPVEVLAIQGEETYLEKMTYGEALNITKKKGWKYTIYQLGFCTVKPTNKK